MSSTDVMIAESPIDVKIPQTGLLNRVAGYSLVGRGLAVYQFAKQHSPQIIKSNVFDLCENVVSNVSQQPLFVKAVESVKFEERGAQLLDKFDSAVERVNDLNRQRQEFQHTVSRAVYEPLDLALEVVDKYLPETGAIASIDEDVVLLSKVAAGEEEEIHDEPSKAVVPVTPSAKLTKLTSKLTKVAMAKFTTLKLRSEEQLAHMQFAVDLIEYAKQHNLVDYAKQHFDEKTVAQVTEKVNQTVAVVHQGVEKAHQAALQTYIKTGEAVLAVTNVAKEKTKQINHLALQLKEIQWKRQFDEIMGPYLATLKNNTQKLAVISISTLAVVADFTLQQFNLTKQREFGKVLENVVAVTKQAVEQTKNLSTESLQVLGNIMESVQQGIRDLIVRSSQLSLTATISLILEIQLMITSGLKQVLTLTSTSSTA